jgi:hypothetical protein
VAEQIDIMEVEGNQHFAQVCRQAGNTIAGFRLVRFSVAALIEGDHPPAAGQGSDLMFKFRRTLRPTMQHY